MRIHLFRSRGERPAANAVALATEPVDGPIVLAPLPAPTAGGPLAPTWEGFRVVSHNRLQLGMVPAVVASVSLAKTFTQNLDPVLAMPGECLVLAPAPHNPFDPAAVQVLDATAERAIGYIRKDQAATVSQIMADHDTTALVLARTCARGAARLTAVTLLVVPTGADIRTDRPDACDTDVTNDGRGAVCDSTGGASIGRSSQLR